MKYEYKVTTAQGMNTLAADGWRVVAMHMNSIIMEREVKEEVVSYGTDKLMLDAIAEMRNGNSTKPVARRVKNPKLT